MICPYNTRTVVALSGADAGQVLQGLITNDIALLNQQPLLYTAWLSAQGRYQFDFFFLKKTAFFMPWWKLPGLLTLLNCSTFTNCVIK